MRRSIFYFLLLIFSINNFSATAQIGVNTQSPRTFTELDIQNLVNGNDTIPKGIMIPRIRQAQRDLINVSNTTDVNSLLIYNIDEDCYNYYSKTEQEWQSLCGKLGKADFTIEDCSRIRVHGVYQNDVALTSANYLTIPVNVTKTGSYSIQVVPDPANGYYFSISGEFLSTGTVEVTIPGSGTPVNYTPAGSDGDEIKITLNGIELDCSNKPKIKIEDTTKRPRFAISCNSVTVHGVYKKGVATTSANKITMRLNVYDGSQGATYSIKTDMIDGLSFSGSGVLGAAGTQEIELYAEGAPYSTPSKLFTITTNSESTTATCQALVVPVISRKKIMAAGSSTYGLTSGGNNGCGAMISDVMNYGDNENSIIQYEGFASVETSSSLSNLATWVGGTEPYDIIIITYNLTPSNAQRALLVDYVNKGGVLIYLDQNNSGTDGIRNVQLVGEIFGETIDRPVDIGTTCNYVIKMNSGVDDEISNGPFGDVRNSQWGEDFSNSCGLPVVPRGAVVYAGAINASTGLASTSGAQATILRHPTKNFFWCGDSGLIHGGTETNNTNTPFQVGSRTFNGVTYPKYPVDKQAYGSQAVENRLPVCNSTLFANVMAWAIRMAEENGINSGK